MITCPLSIPSSPFNNETWSSHVYNDSELTMLASDTKHSFPLNCMYIQVSFFQCYSCFVSLCLKWTITHSKRIHRHALNSLWSTWSWCSNCKAVHGEVSLTSLTQTSKPTHISHHWLSHEGNQHCSPFNSRLQTTEESTNSWCGRVHTEMYKGESLYRHSPNKSCWTCGTYNSVVGVNSFCTYTICNRYKL
jgi:hypothetical protein